MNEKNPDIRRLDYAIASLNDDAESMHSLITRSTNELERATAEGRRSADLADEALKTLAPLADGLQAAIDDAKGLMRETEQAVEKLNADFAAAEESGKEAFESFTAASMKSSEKMRDDLQTDLLSHKTATAARLDSLESTMAKRIDELEGETTRLKGSIDSLGKSLDEKANALQKKVALPLYGVVAVAVLQLLTLVAFFLK